MAEQVYIYIVRQSWSLINVRIFYVLLQVDILHPFASLAWRECKKSPVGISDAQAIMLGDRLYMGGGSTSGSRRNEARLYIYTPTTDTWGTMDTPDPGVCQFALTTYDSQLLLVGGKKYVGEYSGPVTVTNQLWTLDEQNGWQENLPPMKVGRMCVSAMGYGDYLLAAGGWGDKRCDIVEVYNGQVWLTAEPLPKPCENMKSSVLDGCWYLMGGRDSTPTYICDIYFASLDSLITSCQSSETSQPSSIWRRLTDAPHGGSTPAIFGSRLTAVGGRGEEDLVPLSSIHAFSPHNKSWIDVGNLPAAGCDICATVLPTRELIVIGGFVNDTSQVFKASLQGWYIHVFICISTFNVVFIFL